MRVELIFLTFLLIVGVSFGQSASERMLTLEEAKILVMNVPEVLEAKAAYRRPDASGSEQPKGNADFYVAADRTFDNATGTIGNYVVDLHTGIVRREIDGRRLDSPVLEQLRNELFRRPRPDLPLGPVLDLRGTDALEKIREAKTPPSYSLFGIVLGKTFSKELARLPNSTSIEPLKPDIVKGQPLTGFQVERRVEIYLAKDDVVAEINIDAALPGMKSFQGFLDGKVMDLLTMAKVEEWQRLLATDPIVERDIHGFRFFDFPQKGLCVCLYGSQDAVGPVFISFYNPAQAPFGETLIDAVHRRMKTCVR